MPEPTPEQRTAAAAWLKTWRLDSTHGYAEALAELLAEREERQPVNVERALNAASERAWFVMLDARVPPETRHAVGKAICEATTQAAEELGAIFQQHLAQLPPEEQDRLVADALAVPMKDAAQQTTREVNPTCGGCGGPHPFDTSVPSVVWNAVIRAQGLSEYLCTTCIVREFVKAGQSFTATLWGDFDGADFRGQPIEVRVGGVVAEDARRINEENTALRAALDWISTETQEPATRDRAEAALREVTATRALAAPAETPQDGTRRPIMKTLPADDVLRIGEAGNRHRTMAADVQLLYEQERFTSCTALVLCFIDSLASPGSKSHRYAFARFVEAHFNELYRQLAGRTPGKDGGAFLYEGYRNGLVHGFAPKSGLALCRDRELDGAYVGDVAIDGLGLYVGINVDRLVADFLNHVQTSLAKLG